MKIHLISVGGIVNINYHVNTKVFFMFNSIPAFNKALHKADDWLKELKEIGQFETEDQAYTILRSVLHAIRDRLAPDEAIEFQGLLFRRL